MVHRARASKARKSSHKRASEDVFIAEKILGQRDLSKGLHEGDHNRYEYLVRWKGFDASGDTWEPAKNILSQELFEEFEARKAGEEWEPNPYKSFEVTLNFFRGTMTRLVEHCDPVPQDSPCSSSRHSSEGGGSLPRSCAQATPNASITEKHAEDEHKIIRQESMMKEFGERNLPEAKRRRPAGRNESIWSCPEFRAQAFWLAGGVSEKLQ